MAIADTVVGSVAALGGVLLTQLWTSWRERKAREHEVQEQRERQRADFQIKTLTELQDALVRNVRATYILNDIDYHQTFSGVERDSKKFHRWWREWQDTFSLATVLSARVQDPAIKEAVGEIRKTTLGLVTPLRRKGSDLDQSREDAEQLREDLMDNFEELNRRSGERLCELY
jgi:hypothetical protein